MQVEAYALVTAFSFGLSAVLVRKGLSESTAVTATLVISGVQVIVLSLMLVLSPPSIYGIKPTSCLLFNPASA